MTLESPIYDFGAYKLERETPSSPQSLTAQSPSATHCLFDS